MAGSVVEIWNLALIALGGKDTIVSEAEDSNEAAAMRVVWPTVRDELLEETDWPWASGYQQLANLDAIPDPVAIRWRYWQKIPAEALEVREILDTTSGRPTEPTPFEVLEDPTQGPVMACDVSTPNVRYTKRLTTVERYPAGFVSALKYRMAAEVAPKLTSSPGMQQAMMQSYVRKLSAARSRIPGRPPPPEKSTWHAARQ